MVVKLGWIVLVLVALSLGVISYIDMSRDKNCLIKPSSNRKLISDPATADEYIQLGDGEYDNGRCLVAINNYHRALRINPLSAEAYNNLGYVNMRLHNYKTALAFFDRAIELRPNYPHALMNRGDLRNYYLDIDHQKALDDYGRVMSMGKEVVKEEAVCGHMLMAKHRGNWWLATWDILTRNDKTGCLTMYFD